MNSQDYSLQSIGQFLRESRQEEGLDLYDISDRLRIRPAYLFAIEEGDYDVIPGATYALGFVRSYATHLGFDGHEVAAEVKRQLAKTRAEPIAPVLREPVMEGRWPNGMAVAGSLAVAAMAYGLWLTSPNWTFREAANVGSWPGEIGAYLSDLVERTSPAGTGAEVRNADAGAEEEKIVEPVIVRPRIGEDAVAATLLPEMLEAKEPDGAPLALAALTGSGLNELLAQSLVEVDAEGDPPGPAEAVANVYGVTDGTSRISLIAKERSWVQVQSIDQSYRWTRTLEEGERYLMPNRRDLALWTGNAGGLDVIIDGRSIGALGGRGAVVRDVVLLPEELLATSQ